MKTDYYIWQVKLPNYIHGHAFDEVAIALSEAFKELGYDAPITSNPYLWTERTAIVIGCNLLADYQQFFPSKGKYIFYNMEQITPGSIWLTPNYIELLKQYPVWDYSQLNIKALKNLGIEAKLCGIGYSPALSRIPVAPSQDIDVLFIGSMNDRRRHILEELKKQKLNVVSLFGSSGEKRDNFIARAKIIINIHYYESKVFEIVRCSYLMANRKCIVSEEGNDKELEDKYKDAIVFCSYDTLVEECLFLLHNNELRKDLCEDAFSVFSRQSQASMLKKIL